MWLHWIRRVLTNTSVFVSLGNKVLDPIELFGTFKSRLSLTSSECLLFVNI